MLQKRPAWALFIFFVINPCVLSANRVDFGLFFCFINFPGPELFLHGKPETPRFTSTPEMAVFLPVLRYFAAYGPHVASLTRHCFDSLLATVLLLSMSDVGGGGGKQNIYLLGVQYFMTYSGLERKSRLTNNRLTVIRLAPS